MGCWKSRFCRGTLLLALVGCSTARPNLKTPVPEAFVPPPEDDSRYSKPFEYPKELLNRPPVKSTATPGKPGMGGGGGPSMGGGGMGP